MKELYPDLIDYIFEYCSQYYSDSEVKAREYHFGIIKKIGEYPDNVHPMIDKAKQRFLTKDVEALKLLENGYQEFIKNTSTRIYKEHGKELKLNLCAKCGKIARTPEARQCRFCGNDWH